MLDLASCSSNSFRDSMVGSVRPVLWERSFRIRTVVRANRQLHQGAHETMIQTWATGSPTLSSLAMTANG